MIFFAFCFLATRFTKINSFSSVMHQKSMPNTRLYESSPNNNVDMFGGATKETATESSTVATAGPTNSILQARSKLKDDAARLRQEAAELEVAMREEARTKGVPEEMINKLIPLRNPRPSTPPDSAVPQSTTSLTPENLAKMPSMEISTTASNMEPQSILSSTLLPQLGELKTGDPVQFSRQLKYLVGKRVISKWNTADIGNRPSFQANNYQFKSRADIDPKQLKLDDVGYDYQKVLVTAVIVATVLGFSSSYIGGQIGFIFGYLSALIPVTLLGVGSIAPALIGDVINRVNFIFDSQACDQFVAFHAGRFLVGYALGLPISRFEKSAGGVSNIVDFYQLKPQIDAEDTKKLFAKSKYTQLDIAPYSIICLAGIDTKDLIIILFSYTF